MDSVTHIVTGAAIGELMLGKKVGNKALFWGALAGSLPDIDAAFTPFFTSVVDELVYHRGFSHSLIFAATVSILLGLALRKIYRKFPVAAKQWGSFVFVNMIIHIFLDCATTWGTQVFWPHPARIEIKNIFVIDPVFTLPLLVTVIWMLFLKTGSAKRRNLNRIGLIMAWCYMGLTLVNKLIINNIFKEQLQKQNIEFTRYETKPAPLQNIMWSVTAETEDGFYIGYYSHFDTQPDTPYYYFPKNHHLTESVIHDRNVKRLIRLTKGYYAMEERNDQLLLNDLRFGQNDGWNNPDGNFIFSYFIKKEEDGKVEIKQQENSFRNAKRSLKLLRERIKGV